ncbi:MAG TPA: 30S ribosomal protein S2 [Patescibacteria group bacterium]|nr:30S ribosomal protein S2 [Patescibacteria group bacterium]
MRTITLEELLEAGAHFGHQVTRQNPKAREYIFEERDGIHIIDLAKTKQGLDDAAVFVKQLASKPGATMIILGSKRQAQGIVREEVERAKQEQADGLYSVTNRWIGGILTNFTEVSKNFRRLKQLTSDLESKEKRSQFTKKEISLWERERQKLLVFYGGIFEMTKLPDAVFIVDTHLEKLAVAEALATRITTVGITDTNADPTLINYPIPANDDAVGSVKLIVHQIVDAWCEGAQVAKRANDVKEEVKVVDASKEQGAKKEEQKKETKALEIKVAKKKTPVKKGEAK